MSSHCSSSTRENPNRQGYFRVVNSNALRLHFSSCLTFAGAVISSECASSLSFIIRKVEKSMYNLWIKSVVVPELLLWLFRNSKKCCCWESNSPKGSLCEPSVWAHPNRDGDVLHLYFIYLRKKAEVTEKNDEKYVNQVPFSIQCRYRLIM